MKRAIIFLSLVAILIGCLAACDNVNNNTDMPLIKDPDLPLNAKPNTGDSPIELSIDGEEQRILLKLINYLELLSADIEPLDGTVSSRIILMRNQRILHAEVNPNDYYYVCGYFNDDAVHEYENEETWSYCCARLYTWVRIDHEENIPETYDGKKLIVAFQMNGASFVKDVLSNAAPLPRFEHFLIYTPEFENGVNVAEPLYCNKSYLLCTRSENDYVVDSIKNAFHGTYTFYCVKLSGEYYIYEPTNYAFSTIGGTSLKDGFGAYYDELTEIMITDQYSEVKNGITKYYVLFKLDEFADTVWK